MRYSRALALALGSMLAHAVFAQTTTPYSSAGTRLLLSAGVAQDARADETISPLHYAGLGASYGLGIERPIGRFQFVGSLAGGTTSLVSLTQPTSSAQLDQGEAGLKLFAPMRAATRTSGLWLGAALVSRADVTAMRYTDLESTTDHFAFAYSALGPAARWITPFMRGSATFDMSVPVVGVVDQPYSDLKSQRSLLAFRSTTPLSLRATNAAISYAVGPEAAGLVVAYRFGYFSYAGSRSVRSVSQALSLGVQTR